MYEARLTDASRPAGKIRNSRFKVLPYTQLQDMQRTATDLLTTYRKRTFETRSSKCLIVVLGSCADRCLEPFRALRVRGLRSHLVFPLRFPPRGIIRFPSYVFESLYSLQGFTPWLFPNSVSMTA